MAAKAHGKKSKIKRGPSASPRGISKSVEEYLAAVPASARVKLREMRAAIRSVVPEGATETISYRIPAFRTDRIIVWYAAFAHHCSLFPTAEAIVSMKKDLAGFVTSKGTVQFPLDKPLPLELIRKLVRARLRLMKTD